MSQWRPRYLASIFLSKFPPRIHFKCKSFHPVHYFLAVYCGKRWCAWSKLSVIWRKKTTCPVLSCAAARLPPVARRVISGNTCVRESACVSFYDMFYTGKLISYSQIYTWAHLIQNLHLYTTRSYNNRLQQGSVRCWYAALMADLECGTWPNSKDSLLLRQCNKSLW